MGTSNKWKSIGWDEPFWELVRFYCSLRGKEQSSLLDELASDDKGLGKWKPILALDSEVANLLQEYINFRRTSLNLAIENLRTETEAQKFCTRLKASWKTTSTKNKDHHQSSKALIAAVTSIAEKVVKRSDLTITTNPQRRCIWRSADLLHVSARNLDGAIPGLENPFIVWEIKEYWGKTNGGSKMSDAVYECHLVGREIREFEKKSGIRITHVVFLDGKDQWLSRKSDLARFLDLENQGLVDHLFVGKTIESSWETTLESVILRNRTFA